VLKRGGKALVLIGNYGQGSEKDTGIQLTEADAGNIETYDRIRAQGQKEATKPAAGQKKDVVYDAVFKLDLKALGLPDSVRAIDMEQRIPAGKKAPVRGKPAEAEAPQVRPETLKQRGPGVFELPIRRHDFAIIQVE